jgi:cation diffusion facilitator CzcD-associated flavoprotein CzcO
VEKFSVDRFVKLRHEVKDCNYNEAEGKWHVTVQQPDGQVIDDTSDVLISARGGLNHIAWPEIEGLRSFQGETMHSALWNEK